MDGYRCDDVAEVSAGGDRRAQWPRKDGSIMDGECVRMTNGLPERGKMKQNF